jgi:Kef-type K+ transport system membrane component KefB
VLLLALGESMCAAFLVTVGMLVVGQPWSVALLLGAIAVETGAASTLMVVRENNAEGDFTESLIGVIGLNNLLALLAFSIVAATIELTVIASTGGLQLGSVVRALFPLVWQLAGSSALGVLIGILLAAWASQVVESGETLILVVGCILLTVGIATALDLSSLVASLAVGATLVNLSAKSRRLFVALSETDPPLYVIFFVLAGADLDLSLLPSLGVVGAVYVLCRAGGKMGGAWLAARGTESPTQLRKFLGPSILAQAGLAVGLVLVIRERFPDLSPIVSTVVLGAVAVFEVAGPLSARFALDRTGESRPQGQGALPLDP